MIRSITTTPMTTEMDRLADWFDRVFTGSFEQAARPNTMAIDVLENDGKLMIHASVPGIDPEALEVSIENNVLTLRGESKVQHESQESKVYRREIVTGHFTRSLRLPPNLDLDAVTATFVNGIVTITLPRIGPNPSAVRRIPVAKAEPAIETQPVEEA